MTTTQRPSCDEVQMAILARLDGESASLSADDVNAHAAECGVCQAALAELTALHASLGRVDYERLDMDLWPSLQPQVTLGPVSPHRALREGPAILGLTAVLVAWRLAQLLLDWPAPVINSIVPLALIVIVLRRVVGDPFAIQMSSRQLQQKGAL